MDMSEHDVPLVVIADDHPLFREALQRVVAEVFAGYGFCEVPDCAQALSLAQTDSRVELIFLDLNMPGMDGFGGLVALRNIVPSVPIIIVSASEDAATIRESITCGASGFMPKSLSKDDMVAAVRHVLEGGIYTPHIAVAGGVSKPLNSGDQKLAEGIAQLTHQQRVVLQLLVGGKSNKQIAYELSIVESTVKAHVSAILRKLRVHSRTQAVIRASKILDTLRQLA